MDLREAKDDEGRNALDAATTEGQLEVCRFLVEESGFDVKCISANGERRRRPWPCALLAEESCVLICHCFYYCH